MKSASGGTIADGTRDNPHVALDGDWAVYTFLSTEMALTDNNLVKRWTYSGP